MPEQADFKEVTVDWDGYRKVQEDRWEILLNGLRHCKVHDTYFEPEAPDGEPCWGCYNGFSQNNGRCGAYAECWEELGKPKGWLGCSLPKGHEGDHSDEVNNHCSKDIT